MKKSVYSHRLGIAAAFLLVGATATDAAHSLSDILQNAGNMTEQQVRSLASNQAIVDESPKYKSVKEESITFEGQFTALSNDTNWPYSRMMGRE